MQSDLEVVRDANAGDTGEVMVMREYDGIDPARAACNQDVGKGNDMTFTIEVPDGRFDIDPQSFVSGNIDHHIPKLPEALEHRRVAESTSDFAAHDSADGQVACFRGQSQGSQRILSIAQEG